MGDASGFIASQSPVWVQAAMWGCGMIAGGLLTFMATPLFQRVVLRKTKRQDIGAIVEQSFYELLNDGQTVKSPDGSLTCVVSVGGQELSSLSLAERAERVLR
ncbi:hypothetical protein, partial [Azospirillum sp. B4]|uniref:hypothetical protein n=1 Tax=Azospirillum sp. B4 TaxID=95605 RepID=UPI0005C9C0B9